MIDEQLTVHVITTLARRMVMMQADAFCFGQMRLKDPQLCSEVMVKGHVGELWHIKCQRESNKSRAKLRKALPRGGGDGGVP